MRDRLMRKKWQSALIACCLVAVLLASAGTIFASSPVSAAVSCEGNTMNTSHRLTLIGHLIPVLHGLAPLHDMDCNQTLQLTIRLQVRNQAELDHLMTELNDPQSPNYHHYLTTQAYADRFGQPQTVVDQVVAYLQSAGFTILNVAPNRLAITVTGTVAHIAETFAVHLANFQVGSRTVFAPMDEPSVPPQFGTAIQAIIGLSDVAVAHPPR